MTKTLKRVALLGVLAAPFAAIPARAQSPTPEGTVITNTATASWTDANSNTYTPVTASASVTVGFLAGPDVSSPATVTPASPSTGNQLAFTVTNSGNGVDSVSVGFTIGAGVTATGYKLGSTTYTTLAELNAALAATPISAGSSISVTLIYTVAPGQGGQTIPATMTATSLRTPTASDPSTTNIIPPVAAGVSVTPDGGTIQRLPSNGTSYSQTFVVQNTGNRSDTYTLSGGASGAAVSVVSVNGTAGSGSSVTVSAGGSANVTVVYTVGNVAAGTSTTLGLSAVSGNDAAVSDPGSVIIQVIRAAISMTKEAFRDDQTTAINNTTDRVLPGDTIWYKIALTNTGGAPATLTGSGYGVTDVLPAEVTYLSSAGDAAGWTISESSGTVTAKLTGTLAASGSRFFWVRVQVK